MNFATIRNIIDQKDEKGFPQTLAMFGTIREFKGEGVSDTGKPWKKVSIKDNAGELHNVTLRGTLPTAAIVNQRAAFNLSSYNGTYSDPKTGQAKSYIGYSGFWNEKAQVRQGPPQQPPQAPSQPHPAAQKEKVDWDAIAEGKVRHGVLCAMLQGNNAVDYEEVLRHTKFVITGEIPAPDYNQDPEPQNYPDDSPPPTEDEVPF